MLSGHQRIPKEFRRIKAKSLFSNMRCEYEAKRPPSIHPRIFKVEDCLKCNNSKKYYTFYDKYLYRRVSIDNFLYLFLFLLNVFYFFGIDLFIEDFFEKAVD